LDYIFIFLTIVIFAFSALELLPIGLYIIWPKPRLYYDKSHDNIWGKTKTKELQELYEKFEALGFVKLGIKVEKPPLWEKAIKSIELTSTKEMSFASISIVRNQVYFYFYTPFIDGRGVLTSNGVFPTMRSDQLLQLSISSLSPEDVLEFHRKQIEIFTAKNAQPYSEYTQETLIKAFHQYYNTKVIRDKMRSIALIPLIVFFISTFYFIYMITHLFF
jgi:hypothetical protein